MVIKGSWSECIDFTSFVPSVISFYHHFLVQFLQDMGLVSNS